MVATKTSGQVSFLEQASRRVDRGESTAAPAPAAGVAAAAPSVADTKPVKTGVVFVHGIGSQVPGETLLQWSTPLIEQLTAWRVREDLRPWDPVIRAEINFDQGLPAIELDVPPRPGTRTPRRWVLTEAWWASRVQAPSLGTMASWLGPRGAAGQIVDGILGNAAGSGVVTGGLIAMARVLLVPFVTVLVAVVLSVFAIVRALSAIIPIAAVRNSAVLKSFDGFLTGWFGDIRVLLYDPAQSSNIRAGLARSIRGLREAGCTSIVVLAHSGGAMVSYLTLTDPALDDVEVDKLITFGEGWNLALQLSPLEEDDGSANPDDEEARHRRTGFGLADRLRVDITQTQKTLRWRDFWATNDPAPAGPLKLDQIGNPDTSRIRSGRVWNRRSLVDDHGTYWSNQEEFTIPVLQEIDVPNGWGDDSMFYRPDPVAGDTGSPAEAQPAPWPRPGDLEPGPRAARHRQRVATLALWRQVAIVVPVVLIAVMLAMRPERLVEVGREAARLIGMIPGFSHLAGLIGWFNSLEDIRFQVALGPLSFDLIATMQFVGIAVLQAIVLITIVQLIWAPVRAFDAWPKKTPSRIAAAVIEGGLIALLAFALGAIAGGSHDSLLGAGLDWAPGAVLATLVGVGAGAGTFIVKKLASPGATRLFGGGAAALFAVALACSVVAIFGPEGLPDAEVGYLVIWAGAIVLYRLGVVRWHHWDRLEQQIAREPVADHPVNRWPAYLGAGGMIVLLGAAAMALLFRVGELASPAGLPIAGWVAVVAILLLGASYVIGTGDARHRRDPIAAPDPVESSMWL
jgi:hypothetical protein